MRPAHLRYLDAGARTTAGADPPAPDRAHVDWAAEPAAVAKRAGGITWWGVSPPLARKVAAFTVIVLLGALGAWWAFPSPEPVPIPPGFFDDPARLAVPFTAAPSPPATSAPESLYVHVAGEVHEPGLIMLPEGSRVADAITSAGGPTSEANLTGVNLAARVADGEQILVPRVGDPVPAVAGPPTSKALISINTATAAELQALPGIGPVMAERIVSYRETYGAFTSIDGLQAVPGIGPVLLAGLRPEISL